MSTKSLVGSERVRISGFTPPALGQRPERGEAGLQGTSEPGGCAGGRNSDAVPWVLPTVARLTKAQIEYLGGQRLGRIATTGADGKPHVVPTSFRYNGELGTLDVGGLHVATTKKYRDVQANPSAALVVDDLVSTDPWTPRMLEVRGRAEAITHGGANLGDGFGDSFIRIFPEKVNSFGIE